MSCRYWTADVSWRRRVLVSEGRKRSCMSSCRVLRSCSRKFMTRNTLVFAVSLEFKVKDLSPFAQGSL